MTKFLIGIFFSFFFINACSQPGNPEIAKEDFKNIIEFIASDSLKGRFPGTPEDSLLNTYLVNQFISYGLSPFNSDYIQRFELVTGSELGKENKLESGGKSYELGKEFYPIGFSASAETEAEVVFGGYGIKSRDHDLDWNDFAGLDVKGKWLMVFSGIPENKKDLVNYSNDRDKCMKAKDLGAKGVILVMTNKENPEDELQKTLIPEPAIDMPVIQMTRSAANSLFIKSDLDLDKEENPGQAYRGSYKSDHPLKAKIKLQKKTLKTANIIAFIQGEDPKLRNNWIVIGAHHDHLGMGGRGNSSRMPDTLAVHNGADDNASGVSAVLELAAYFSDKSNRLSRSLLFVTFGAEEKGLVGSKYFVENCPVDTKDILAMINIDMLGRMSEDSSLQIGGIGTALESRQLVEKVNKEYGFNLSLSDAGYGPSDHASFYSRDIPVFFFSTGAHQDYHTPFDDIDSLNFTGLSISTHFISDLVKELSDMDSLSFREDGPKVSTGRSYKGSVTLGIMPDVSGNENGLKVLAVTENKAGAIAGLKKGDIITSLDEWEIKNVYDYMYRLKEYKSGQSCIVSVLRAGEKIELLVYFN